MLTLPAYLRLRDVIQYTGLSKSSIYKKVKENTFPAPVKLSAPPARASGWKSSQLLRWAESPSDWKPDASHSDQGRVAASKGGAK
jgi:prophage regulatory protein